VGHREQNLNNGQGDEIMRYATWGLVVVLAAVGLTVSLAVAEEKEPAAKASESKASDTKAPAAKEPAEGAGKESTAGTIEVKLGQTIARTLDQIKADNFAYGPKQDYNAKADETHIYLPYGDNPKLYTEVRGALVDPKAGSVGKFKSPDGKTNAALTYKLHFDKPIGTFRFQASFAELDLRPDTVAGVEFSADGKTWETLYEIKGDDKGIKRVPAFVKDATVIDLNRQTLFIRIFTRDPKNPDASGPGRWIQLWMAGDPGWGDAATTFAARQMQVWVTPAAKDAKDAPVKKPAAKESDTKAPAAKAPAAKPADK